MKPDMAFVRGERVPGPGPRIGAQAALHHVLPGTPDGVRAALALVGAALQSGAMAPDGGPPDAAFCATVELVLAEVLNNIVEHAFAAVAPAARHIAIDLTIAGGALRCTVRDRGAAMPSHRLPAGVCPDVTAARDALAEGGYGWFLIRSLTQDLHYARDAGGNRLSFAIALPPGIQAPL